MSCVLCWSVNGDSNCKTDAVQKRSLSLKAIAENSLTPILQIRVGLIGVISSVVTAKPYKTPLNVKQYQGHDEGSPAAGCTGCQQNMIAGSQIGGFQSPL